LNSSVANALEIEDVTAGYGRTQVLTKVSLTVRAGEAVALLGPNGAGKTTLLRAVSGFLEIQSGSITLFGESVLRVAPHVRSRRGLCHVPEGRGVFGPLTVRENLMLQARKQSASEPIDQAAAFFPVLGSRLDVEAHKLSGGEQQMLALAAAYVSDARLVVVDEPSLGLAPLVVDQVFEFIEGLVAMGKSILVVDQFANRALALASRAFVLRRGEIVFGGPSSALLRSDLVAHYLEGV
jgi:branched-chain amino acid transport system ATP-binding protein